MGFSIDADNLSWINGSKDDPEDLCLHGHAAATIGDRKFEYDAAVSAAALYLLKTIEENHIIHQDNQMLPCCGFFIVANEALDNVVIIGCPNGIDWSVLHNSDGFVTLVTDDGTEEVIPLADYKAEVYKFADKIESFYSSCSPKILPKDPFDRNGYIAFWNEWHRRRN